MKTATDSEIKEAIQMMLDHLLRSPSEHEWLSAEGLMLDRKNFTVSFLVRLGDESQATAEGMELNLSTLKPLQDLLGTEGVRVTALASGNTPRIRVTYYNVFRDLKELVH